MIGCGRPTYVLDSYAFLAWLQGEPGEQAVTDLLKRAGRGKVQLAACLVNLGEVLYIVEREHSIRAAQRVLGTIDAMSVLQVAPTRDLVLTAAHFKAIYRLSYEDCFAMALARHLSAAVVTGDPEFRRQDEVDLLWIGQA
jgi:ribonuclease VapC